MPLPVGAGAWLAAGFAGIPAVFTAGGAGNGVFCLSAGDLCRPLAEDPGLCIRALNGEPGVYTKRYAEQHGGFPKVFDVLAERMKDNPDKSSYFNCTMALVVDETQAEVFEGIFEGDILPAPRGKKGFGYDPVFVPKGYDKTVAELSEDEKNTISHRALALKKVAAFLEENNI